MTPRIACLGLGWIGRHRLQALVESGEATIVGLADVEPAAVAAAAIHAPDARQGRTLGDLLALEPDGVMIATPSANHASEAIEALTHRCAVFCQKPLARNAVEAASVVATARARHRLLDVDLSYRHLAATAAIDALIADGALGELIAIDLTFHNAYGPGQAWYYDRTRAGGGCLLDLGIHLVDLLARWTGEMPFDVRAAALSTEGRPWTPQAGEVEHSAFVQLESASGVAARLACSWGTPSGCDAVIEARLFGTRAGSLLHNVGGSYYAFAAERLDRGQTVPLAAPPDAWGGRAAVAWARALANGAGFDRAAERFVDRAMLLDRCYEVAARRRPRIAGAGGTAGHRA
jgi:predicted dehydrogenase